MTFAIAVIIASILIVIEAAAAFLVWSASRAERIEARNKELALAAASGEAAQQTRKDTRIARMLTEAGFEIDPRAFIAACAGLTVATALLGYFIAGIASGTVFAAVTIVGTWFFLVRKRAARKGAFEQQLCEALPMIAEGIRSGMTFERAAQNAAAFMDDPISSQFKRMALERSYGATLAEAVENMAQRTGSRDMVELSAVVAINAQTGGNMAGIIDSVAKNMQSRARLRRHVSSVTANGRLSKAIISAIPIVLFAVLLVLSPSYILTLTKDFVGWVLLAVTAVFIVLGNLVIKRLYNIKIY